MSNAKSLFNKILVNNSLVDIDQLDQNNGLYQLGENITQANAKFELKTKTIPAGVFSNNKQIKSVTINSTVESIADGAFTGTSISEENIEAIKAINPKAYIRQLSEDDINEVNSYNMSLFGALTYDSIKTPAVEAVEGVHYSQEEIDAAIIVAAKTTSDWKVEPVTAQNAIYSFESFNDANKSVKYGDGKVEVIEMRAGGATVEVIENVAIDPNAENFVGQQFNVATGLATNEPIQLYTLTNEPIDIWVTITLVSDAVAAVDGVHYTQEEIDDATTIAAKTISDWKVEPVEGSEAVLYTEQEVNEHNANLPGALHVGDDLEKYTNLVIVVDGDIENALTYVEDQTITLDPGHTYEISGILNGKIIVNAQADHEINGATVASMVANEILESTNFIFNNVEIYSDDCYGVLYDCPDQNNAGYKGLVITMKKNTINKVICNKAYTIETPQEDLDNWKTYASIDSWKNLVIQGTGYLKITNNIGHGLRGEDLSVIGPNIDITTTHDGVHGDKVNVFDGIFNITGAVDGFGTTDNGKINVFGGKYQFNNIEQDTFDSGKNGYYTIDGIDGNKMYSIEDKYEEGVVTAYHSKADYDAKINGTIINPTTQAIKEVIYYNADNNMNVVASQTAAGFLVPVISTDSTTGADVILIGSAPMYVIGKNYPIVEVTGKITAPIIRPMDAITIDTPTFSKKGKLNGGYDNNFDIYLNGAVIATSYDGPSIANLPDAGRVKITAIKDTINAIINKTATGIYDLDAVKSENNMIIEVKKDAILYITSAGGDGLDGGDMKITDSKGNLVINNCAERGIKGTYVVIGPNADIPSGIINPYTDPNDTENYTTFDGVLVVKGNCVVSGVSLGLDEDKTIGFADIYGRNGKHTKGKVLFTNDELKGVAIVGSIGARDVIDLGNAKNLFYEETLIDPLHPIE